MRTGGKSSFDLVFNYRWFLKYIFAALIFKFLVWVTLICMNMKRIQYLIVVSPVNASWIQVYSRFEIDVGFREGWTEHLCNFITQADVGPIVLIQ